MLLTFLSGGLATASNTMHWSLTLLAARPEIQETAYKAIREVYPDNKQLFDSVYKDTEEVQYISALVRECLRCDCHGIMCFIVAVANLCTPDTTRRRDSPSLA